MAERAEIMRASIGPDHASYATNALAFDYERVLTDTDYDMATARAAHSWTAVGDTPLVELKNVRTLVRCVARPSKGAPSSRTKSRTRGARST